MSDISYNTLGNIEQMRLGNGTWESNEYNSRQQISQIALGQFENDKSLLKIDYDYGSITENNGSLKQQKISYNGLTHEIVQDYTYDELNRLKSATEKSNTVQTWKQTFRYDRYGNREFDENNTDTLANGVASKITNPNIEESSNRLTKDQDSDAVIDYDYDKSGNVTLDAENQRFIYDAENRIKTFFKGTNNSQNEQDADGIYQYDGDGKRVRKLATTPNGREETIFVYNASGQLVAEYSTKMPDEAKISYLTTDHLGSPRIITNDEKEVVSRHDYLAFGDEVTTTVGNVAGRTSNDGYGEDDNIRKQYTGYERDKESGLDFAQARYYNSQQGRFTSVDPLTASASIKNPQTFNRYSYVLNSPYKFVDPLGLISRPANEPWCSTCFSGWGDYDEEQEEQRKRQEQQRTKSTAKEDGTYSPDDFESDYRYDSEIFYSDIGESTDWSLISVDQGWNVNFDTELANDLSEIGQDMSRLTQSAEANGTNAILQTYAFLKSQFKKGVISRDVYVTALGSVAASSSDDGVVYVPNGVRGGKVISNSGINLNGVMSGGSRDPGSTSAANPANKAANKANDQFAARRNIASKINNPRRQQFIKKYTGRGITMLKSGQQERHRVLSKAAAGLLYDRAVIAGQKDGLSRLDLIIGSKQ